MATMTFDDIVVNKRFLEVSFLQTIALNRFIMAGIAKVDPELEKVIASFSSSGNFVQGDLINIPLLKDVDDEDQILTDSAPLVMRKTTMDQDVASIKRSGHAFERSDLAVSMNTVDPILALANALAEYWNRRYQDQTFAMLNGVFASNVANNSSDLVLDISGLTGDDGILTGNAMLIAAQLLGDVKENLVAVAMHSEVETFLNIIGAISPLEAPANNPMVVTKWNQRTVVMDDSCAYNPTTKVAEIILFKAGALALNNIPVKDAYELDRDSKAGKDWFISRRGRVIHCRGVKYTKASQAKEHATNAEYATAANWSRIVEKKRIGVVKLKVRLG